MTDNDVDDPGSSVSDQFENELEDQTKTVVRNSSVMAAGSILSRLTGIARDIALAAALGQFVVADLFTLGNQLPDVVYVLLIGGALQAVFVPQLVRRMKDDADGGKSYSDSLLSATLIALLVVTVVAVIAAPLIVRIYATSAYSEQELSVAIAFARYCLPQILFFGIYAMFAQVLNARGHFAVPMFAPILNNIVAVATYTSFAVVVSSSVVSSGNLTEGQIAWLGIGTTLGIVAQSVILIPVAIRTGYRFRFTPKLRGMGLRKAARLAGWTVGLVAATQAGLIVASRLTTAANQTAAETDQTAAGLAAYNRAYLVFMIPHGILTVSLVTAQLPNLSRLVHAGKDRIAAGEISHTMRLVAFVVTPVAVALMLSAGPLAAFLFSVGNSSAEQASQLGIIIAIFMVGLLPFTLYYVLQRGWYAREDTRTPFFLAVFMNLVFAGLAIVLFFAVDPGPTQVYAVAGAYALSNWLVFAVAWTWLSQQYKGMHSLQVAGVLIRIVVAGCVAAGGVWVLHRWVFAYSVGDGRGTALVDLVATAAVALMCFLGASAALRVPELSELWRMARRRRVD